MNQTSYMADTSPEAYAVQLELLRRMSPIERLRKTFTLSRHVKRMSMAAIRRLHPEFDEEAVRLKFIERLGGTRFIERPIAPRRSLAGGQPHRATDGEMP